MWLHWSCQLCRCSQCIVVTHAGCGHIVVVGHLDALRPCCHHCCTGVVWPCPHPHHWQHRCSLGAHTHHFPHRLWAHCLAVQGLHDHIIVTMRRLWTHHCHHCLHGCSQSVLLSLHGGCMAAYVLPCTGGVATSSVLRRALPCDLHRVCEAPLSLSLEWVL